jgi:hypothetical protein
MYNTFIHKEQRKLGGKTKHSSQSTCGAMDNILEATCISPFS